MNVLPSSAISALDIAAKLAAVHNRIDPAISAEFEQHPEQVEIIWFVHWAFTEAGGADQFVKRLVDSKRAFFVTEEMRACKTVGGLYSLKDVLRLWGSLPRSVCKGDVNARTKEILRNWQTLNLTALAKEGMDQVIRAELTPEWFASACATSASHALSGFLRKLCTRPEFSAHTATMIDYAEGDCRDRSFSESWWSYDILGALRSMMDDHVEKVSKRISRTSVVEKVWDALEYAWHTKGFVTIEGNTRFGKTEAVRTWCEMYPWRVRYIAAPYSSSERELLTEVAGAFRLPYTWSTPEGKLREEISFLLQFGRIGLIVDEAQFMVPTRYSKGTSPHRLNWFRTQLVDKRVPCAMCYTGQFTKDLERFAKNTGYVEDQWLGRPKLCVKLTEELPNEDVLRVAQSHLPWCSEWLHMQVAGRAKDASSFLKALEDVADRARWVARKAGRETPTEADTLKALQDTLPAKSLLVPEEVHPPTDGEAPAPVTPTRRGRHAKAPVTGNDLPINRLNQPSAALVPLG